MQDLAGDVGQSHFAAGVEECEGFVVEAHEVQDRGMQVMDVDFLFHGGIAEVVRGAMNVAGAKSAAGEP